MNDYIVIVGYILALVVFLVGMISAIANHELKSFLIGTFNACIICLLAVDIVSPLSQNEYEKLPYLNAPTVYELSENDMENIFQTGEANSITFFDSDGEAHTIEYSELSMQYKENAIPSVLVYYREESTKWLFRDNIPKIVILMPEPDRE